RTYKGSTEKSVTIPLSGTTCDVPFDVGKEYLIYGSRDGRTVRTDSCTPTRLLSHASDDVKYLENAQRNVVAGSLFGDLLHRRPNALGSDPLPGPLRVVAEGQQGTFETITTRAGWEIDGLLPGPYTLRAYLKDTPVSASTSVSIAAGECKSQMIIWSTR